MGYSEIKYCYSMANIELTSDYMGGLVGYNYVGISSCYTTAEKLVGSQSSYYGYKITDSYYLSNEETDSYDGTTAKTAEQFASGEVAFLLQSAVTEEDIYDEDWNWIDSYTPEVWGQTIGADSYPLLGDAAVYQVTDCAGNPAYSNYADDTIGHVTVVVEGKDATCTEDGLTDDAVCHVCGETLIAQETIPAFGHAELYKDNGDGTHTVTCGNGCGLNESEEHTFVDGLCACGAEGEVVPTEPTEVDIKISHSVSFDSDLKMNYRIKYENIASAVPNYVTEGAYLVVEKDQYLATGETAVDTVNLYPDLTTDSTRMLFNLSGIQSVEMGSELRAVLHVFDAEGKEYVTPVDAYSVLAYAQLCYDSYTYAAQPQLYTMLIDALNYGSAAQTYFGRRADELVNAGMEAYQQYATTELSAALDDVKTTVENDRSITAVTKMGFSVTFADKTEMNAKLTIADGYSKEDITCVKILDAEGNVLDTLTDFVELSDGRLQVTYYGVKSIQMRDMFYFVAYVGDQIASDNIGYSVEAYAKSNVGSTNAALAEMALQCIYYGDAAYAYFNR